MHRLASLHRQVTDALATADELRLADVGIGLDRARIALEEILYQRAGRDDPRHLDRLS